MFSGQEQLQLLLVMIALLCVPILLLGKPIHEMCARKRHAKLVSWLNSDIRKNSISSTSDRGTFNCIPTRRPILKSES